MLINATKWILTDFDSKIKNYTQFNRNSSTLFDTEPVWISLSLIIIIVFTIAGNSLVCIAVIRERHLRSTTNYFLTSLAFTDCLVASLVMPIALTIDLIGHFPFDGFMCNIWSTFDVCCCTSSIWHMSVMSLDRYLTLKYPLKYGRNKRRSLVAYKIIIIWFISFAICLPLFILGIIDTSNVYNETTQACFPTNRTFKIYGSFVAFFIPLTIMIITYALTMNALRQAYTTKRQTNIHRKKVHAVINLAAIAIRWKRAVNTVEIYDRKKSSIMIPDKDISTLDKRMPINYQFKRSSSLITNEHRKQSRSASTQCFIDSLNPLSPKKHQNQLKPLLETTIEQTSNQHLEANISKNEFSLNAKRSNSCTPSLNDDSDRKGPRCSASVHAILELRRNSAKISEELANLTAQLSASMNCNQSISKRTSLSIRDTTGLSKQATPTIDQLLAETIVNQPIVLSNSFLTDNRRKRERSHSADIQLPIFKTNDCSISTINNIPIPNLLVTDDNLKTNYQQIKRHSTNSTTCQRIKDWITITTPNILNTTRCASDINIKDQRMKQNVCQTTNLKRQFPRLEQLYGKTTSPSFKFNRFKKPFLLNDHISSVQDFANIQRNSICSIASSMGTARFQETRPSTSSIGSASIQGATRKRAPRFNDEISRTSFQMLSLDTDDTSSSCTSSLTQQSTALQSALAGTNSPTSVISDRRRQRFKNLTKNSASNERKAMRVLLIIFCIFVISWTPFFIMNLVSCFTSDIHPILISIATWLGYCSSCANPIIYTIFSRAFRQAFINILACRKVMDSARSSQMLRSSNRSITRSIGRQQSSFNRGLNDLQFK